MATKLRDDRFMVVLAISYVLGMVVAFGVYFLWRAQGGAAQFDRLATTAALVVCPPFVLSYVASVTPESPLSLILVIGTIVFANGFLYAGVAAGGYFLYTLRERRGN